MQNIVKLFLENLEKNNMQGYYAEDKEDLHAILQYALLPENATVGCGDSVTLQQMGVYHFLRQGPYHFLDKYAEGITPEEKRAIYLQNFDADVFITGTNAATIDGRLFNIDGNGSRVAPMIYGPRKVIVIIGRNKLVNGDDEAMLRMRTIAAPADAARLGKETPCAYTGACSNCNSPARICNSFVCIAHQTNANRIHVVVVNDVLGY